MRTSLLCVLVLATACNTGDNVYPRDGMPGNLPMVPIASGHGMLSSTGSCDNLHGALRARERRILDRQLDANMIYALQLVNNPDDHCEDPDDNDCGFFGFGCSDAAMFSAPMARSDSGGGAEDYSTTNVQEVGVDEPDFIKNDDRTIYVVADQEMHIYDAWPVEDAELLSTTAVVGRPQRMFVHGGRAVVFATPSENTQCAWDEYYGATPENGSLLITVWDVSDPTQPTVERRLEIDGDYVGARMIDGVVHVTVDFARDAYERSQTSTWPEDLPENLCANPVPADLIEAAFEQLRADNHTAVDAMEIDYVLPTMSDQDFDAGVPGAVGADPFAACQHYYDTDAGLSRGFLTLLSFPVADDSTLGAATIFGRHGTIYGSLSSIYIAVTELVDDPGARPMGFWRVAERTVVHKMTLSPDAAPAAYAGSGQVPGRIINQFAMDEHQGNLRIATTEGSLGSTSTNNVFVLGESSDGLQTVGEIRGIAPTEDIRSVRFDGDRGFMVTFKKTDPLYTFDLSVATNPRVRGELKIPGFSTYMHFLDNDHILSIGFDGDDQGTFAWFQGVALQIFDVSDMSRPALLHKETIGTRGTSSEATNDHMAFNYFPSRDLLAIPMALCEGSGGGGSYGDRMTFNGLLVYRVTVADGFESLGGVDHMDPYDSDGSNCHSWWTNPSSKVKRSVFFEDYVYSLSANRLKGSHVPALEQDIVSFTLPGINEEPRCNDWW